jgi:hypothetical protein
VIDAVEALGDVSIEHILGALLDALEDGHDRIMTGPAGSEPEAVGLEPGFPLGFQCELDQRLPCSVGQGGNAEGPLFVGSGLGNPDPTDGLWPGIQMEAGNQVESRLGFEGGNAIDTGSVLALVVLGHPADGQTLGRPGTHQ